MENTARVIEVDFVNRRKVMPYSNDIDRLAKHTTKFEAHLKKLEEKRQARMEMRQSCRNTINEMLADIGADKMNKADLQEGLGMFCLIVSVSMFLFLAK